MDLSKRIKRHVIAVPHDFRAICHPGFEKTCAGEFSALGVQLPCQISTGAVDFSAKLDLAWKLVAFSRTCTRIVMRVGKFSAENFGRLEKKAAMIPWELYFPRNPLPEIKVTCRKSRLYHSDAVAERLRIVVGDALLRQGILPEGNRFGERQTLFAHFENDCCTLSVDLCGDPLYKRGFDRHVEEAPIRDTFAAAMLLEAGFPLARELFDPMAGSGTFSSEAALWKAKANLWKTRNFALQDAPYFRSAAWNFMVNHTPGIGVFPELKIYAGDVSEKALSTIRHNLETDGAGRFLKNLPKGTLEISKRDFFDIPKASPGALLVLNPPYGKRIPADVLRLYREISQKIALDFSNANWALVVPGKMAESAVRLNVKKRVESVNGGIRVSVLFG